MLTSALNLLNKLLDLFPDPDGGQQFKNADEQTLKELANQHVQKEIWKSLKETERQKIKYYRALKSARNKAEKLRKKGIILKS